MNNKTEYKTGQFEKTIDVKLGCDDVCQHDGKPEIVVREGDKHHDVLESFSSELKQQILEHLVAEKIALGAAARISRALFEIFGAAGFRADDSAENNPAANSEARTPPENALWRVAQEMLRKIEDLPGVKDTTSMEDVAFGLAVLGKIMGHECVRDISVEKLAEKTGRSHVTFIKARDELLRRLGITSAQCRTPEARRHISEGSKNRIRRQRSPGRKLPPSNGPRVDGPFAAPVPPPS